MIFWLFILAAFIQCSYALYFFVRIFSLPDITQPSATMKKGVSVIICAKNEAENLRQNLPDVLSQKYGGKYEVIVVNDASTDDTGNVLKELEQRYDHLWDVIIASEKERTLKGKKYALSKGLAAAKYDRLLLTDADCKPASDRWLEQMVAPLGIGKEIVAGYGGYVSAPGLLNAFIRWETLHTFLQYSTYALAGIPYMAVGRNLACTKSVLQRAQQSEVWNALPSGDDDLLVSICSNEANTAIVCEENAFTCTHAKANWKDWMRQKQRHLSTGKYYKGDIKLLLGLYGVSHAFMWLCFFWNLSAAADGIWNLVLILMVVRCGVYWLLWGVTAGKLREKGLIFLFPFFDIGWMVYNFAFFPYIALKNKKHWK